MTARRLEVTRWTDQLDRSVSVIILAFILGVALGMTVWRPTIVRMVAAVYTLIFLPYQFGAEYSINIDWVERLVSIVGRLNASLQQFFMGESIADPILFVASMFTLLWFIGLTGGYLLTRYGKPWIPLAVAGVALACFDAFQPYMSYPFYSGAFMFATIILIARMYFLGNLRRYEASGIGLDEETGSKLARSAIIASLVIVWLAWNIPVVVRALQGESPERRQLIETAQDFNDTFSRLFAPLQGPAVSTSEMFGSDLALGTVVPLSDDIVFTVKVSDKPENLPRFYWRARSYEYYENGQWHAGVVMAQNRQPGDDIIPPPLDQGRAVVTISLTSAVPISSQLFAPPTVLSVSRSVNLLGVRTGAALYDSVGISISPPVRAGETYQVDSQVAVPSREQLLGATSEYPEWVRSRYLRLPDGMPKRFRTLAEEVTANLTTPYEKAQAITNYLRANINYATSVEPAPGSWDPIDWFLFESKTGFCYYYASAETLMLRAVGIPARVAVGYAQGDYDESTKEYIVRRKHAHAWTEVYFTGLGWVEFEPTSTQPVVMRPSEAADSPALPSGGIERPSGMQPETDFDREGRAEREFENTQTDAYTRFLNALSRNLGWLLAVLGSLALVLVALTLKNRGIPIRPAHWIGKLYRKDAMIPDWLRKWQHYETLSNMERSFRWVSTILTLLHVQSVGTLTPKEQVAALIMRIPEGETPAKALLDEYEKTAYAPQPGCDKTARRASGQLVWVFIKTWFENLVNGTLSSLYENSTDEEY